MDPARSVGIEISFPSCVLRAHLIFLVKHKIFSFPRNVPQDIRNHRIKAGCRFCSIPVLKSYLLDNQVFVLIYDILYILDMFKNLIICHCINFKKHRVGKPLGNALICENLVIEFF